MKRERLQSIQSTQVRAREAQCKVRVQNHHLLKTIYLGERKIIEKLNVGNIL